jgi:hypothetical protein
LAEVLEVAIRLDPAPVDLRLKGEAAVFEALDQGLARARARFGDHLQTFRQGDAPIQLRPDRFRQDADMPPG